MTYSIIDIIKNGKPGERFLAETNSNTTITVRADGDLIFMHGLTFLSLEKDFIIQGVKENWQFEKVESVDIEWRVNCIINDVIDKFEQTRGQTLFKKHFVDEAMERIKPYLKEEA